MFTLPPLKYDFAALEPHIDAKTMEIHHDKHHATYVDNLNKALENHEWKDAELEIILAKLTANDTVFRNNGGGHYNHKLFWELLSSTPGNISTELQAEIDKEFGSMDQFKEAFATAAKSRFGSGWAWLIVDVGGKLKITTTPNQDNPLMLQVVINAEQGTPILGLDVWEHAYYLNYQNRRPDYINAFWNVVDWAKVSELFASA